MDFYKNNLPTVRQLQCFLAVSQELSFSRASELLNLSQPPITRQVKILEENLGCKLFHRDTHEVSLTKEGRVLIKEVKEFLQKIDSLKKSINYKDKINRIGISNKIDYYKLANSKYIINSIQNEVEIIYNCADTLCKCLSSNNIDMAILIEKQDFVGTENIKNIKVDTDDLNLVFSKKINLNINSLSDKIKQYTEVPFYWFPRKRNESYFRKFENIINTLFIEPCILECELDYHLIIPIIKRGKGITIIPKSLCNKKYHSDLNYVNISKVLGIKLNIYLMMNG